ncbi:unnamed protein product, partial [Owenia fusiformis]
MATGAPECVCNIICTFDYNPVCGQKGDTKKTYGNRCALDSAICKSKGTIKYISDGGCPSDEPKQEDDKPKCNSICTLDYTPVCGYDGTKYKTYSNQCALDAAICESEGTVRFIREGECPDNENGEKPKCNSICTLDYTPVCGYDGTKYKTYGNQCALDA